MRVGFGYDVHRLVVDRPLWLGGVEIPYEKGLLGHSDADVLLHAICDALLGAANLHDIGYHFPDTDDRWKGVASSELLKRVGEMLDQKGYTIGNIDATICVQAPKLQPFIPLMQTRISETLGITVNQVSVKATTTEGLGFTGTGEGISAYSVALIEEKE